MTATAQSETAAIRVDPELLPCSALGARPDIAAANVNNSHYANANGASWELLDPEILNNPAIFPTDEVWEVLYPIKTADPKRERPRTRAFASAKSGI